MKGPAKKHQRAAYRVGWPHQIEGVNDEKMNATDSEGTVLKVCRLREGGRKKEGRMDGGEQQLWHHRKCSTPWLAVRSSHCDVRRTQRNVTGRSRIVIM